MHHHVVGRLSHRFLEAVGRDLRAVRADEGGDVSYTYSRLIADFHDGVACAHRADHRIKPLPDQYAAAVDRFARVPVGMAYRQRRNPGRPLGHISASVAHAVPGSQLLDPHHPCPQPEGGLQDRHSPLNVRMTRVSAPQCNAWPHHVEARVGEVEHAV